MSYHDQDSQEEMIAEAELQVHDDPAIIQLQDALMRETRLKTEVDVLSRQLKLERRRHARKMNNVKMTVSDKLFHHQHEKGTKCFYCEIQDNSKAQGILWEILDLIK